MSQVNRQEQGEGLPQTYLDLIYKVGGKGKYQYILTFVSGLSNYVTGVVLMSTSFIFNNPQFDCEASGLLTDQCYDHVCSLPKDQWASFVTTDGNKFRSLANQFQSYFCDDEVYLNAYSSAPYFGTFIGCFVIAILADNFGRRTSFLISNAITIIGCLTLIFAQSLWMASLGLVLCGMGSDSIYGTIGSIQAQCCSDYYRQKIGAIIQGTFTVGALVATLFYYLFQSWLISTIYALTIPAFINAFLFFWYIKESPMYLIRQSPQKALREINEIGWINKKQKDILTMTDIEHVMECQQTVKYDLRSSPIDIFKYRSLRTLTFALGLIGVSTSMLYYGPTLIIDQFGFDIYTSQTILNVADILSYYPLMLIINKVKRPQTASILFAVATIMSFILTFITKPDNCDGCPTVYLQLALVFIFRFAISMQYTLFLIYAAEVYPTRVRNISGGVLSIFSTGSSTLSPIIMGTLTRANINHFILFTILGLLAIGCYNFCPETLGKLCPEEIEEIEYEKDKNQSAKSALKDDKLHKY